MEPIPVIWEEILAWASVHAPTLLASIRPGATVTQIVETERLLGAKLPPDVVESYLFHDGQYVNDYDGSVVGFNDGCELLSLQRMLQQWSGWNDSLDRGDFKGISSAPDGPVKPDWWNTKWIP